MKNINRNFVAILALAFAALISVTTNANAQSGRGLSQQDELRSKCPPDSRCLFFTGEDTNRTDVQISNGASALLKKWGIALENSGTKLVWITNQCAADTDTCANVDLTGRHPNKVVPRNDLNKTVKMTAVGTDTVKITFEEFDGDTGEYNIVRGKANIPRVRR